MFKFPFLRNILLLLAAAITMLGLYEFFYVHPSFDKLLAEHAEEDAVRAATHMQSRLISGDAALSKDAITADFIKEVKAFQGEFHLEKVKVFSPSGEVIYSTDAKDFGYINQEKYFHEIVLKGNTYAKVVEKGVKSLEGQKFRLHVVETYVPVVRSGRIVGVFEIYLDVTGAREKVKRLILFADFTLFGLAFIFLTGGIAVSFKAGKALAERERIELKLRQVQKAIETVHIGMTITDKEGKIIYINPTDAAMHGYAVEELLGQNVSIFAPPGNRKPIRFEEMKAFKYWERESVNIRKDGGAFPVYLASDVILNSKGAPVGVATACMDISERKQTEKQIIRQSAEIKEINYELSVLYRVSSAMGRTIDMGELLPIVLSAVTGISMFAVKRKGGIFLVEGDRMRLVSHLGHSEQFLNLHKGMKVGECLCGLAAKTGEIIVSKNSSEDARHSIKVPDTVPHGHIIVPLKAANKTVGVLYLYTLPGLDIDEQRLKMLATIGNEVGIALENAKLYEETKLLSLQDPLTGLANRRLLDLIFERGFLRAQRFATPLSVIMLDIDHFKNYNDTLGHMAGDKALTEVAKTALKETRETDLVSRYGGEEFFILLPEADTTQAYEVAERIRRAVGAVTDVTVSLGISSFHKDIHNKKELVNKADEALYLAKQKGRNRTEISTI